MKRNMAMTDMTLLNWKTLAVLKCNEILFFIQFKAKYVDNLKNGQTQSKTKSNEGKITKTDQINSNFNTIKSFSTNITLNLGLSVNVLLLLLVHLKD